MKNKAAIWIIAISLLAAAIQAVDVDKGVLFNAGSNLFPTAVPFAAAQLELNDSCLTVAGSTYTGIYCDAQSWMQFQLGISIYATTLLNYTGRMEQDIITDNFAAVLQQEVSQCRDIQGDRCRVPLTIQVEGSASLQLKDLKIAYTTQAPVCDADGDTYPSTACGGTDCNDNKAGINPGTGFCYNKTTTLQLNPGWNMVSLELADGIRPSDLLANYTQGNCTRFAAWTGSSWAIYLQGLPLNNKPINASRGYMVLCTISSTITLHGMKREELFGPPPTLSGWNLLSMAYADLQLENATASGLAAALLQEHPEYIGASVAMWTGSAWRIYRTGLPVNNFVVSQNASYFFRGETTPLQTRNSDYVLLAALS